MSADLFAAFGSPNVAAETQRTISAKPHGHESIKGPEDTWQPRPSSHVQSKPSIAVEEQLWRTKQDRTDILFDADDYQDEDGDDFGAFEQAESNEQPTSQRFARSTSREQTLLLDLAENESTKIPKTSQITVSPPGLFLAQQQPVANQVHPWQTTMHADATVQDDEWGDFAEMRSEVESLQGDIAVLNPPESKAVQPLKGSTTSTATTLKSSILPPANTNLHDDFDSWEDLGDTGQQPQGSSEKRSSVQPSDSKRERPTNVPPPVVVLNLLSKVTSELASRTRRQEDSEELGRDVRQIYIVIARVLSGRNLRWKRDAILAQSMRIGAAGRSGGMKLVAIDKGETRKEDQEAEDLISHWTRSGSILNQAMMRAKIPKPAMTLSTKLSARTVTGADILVATHVCPICGLKRNERINGIDWGESDIFGEYWVEHWGHKDCSEVWYKYNHMLEQR